MPILNPDSVSFLLKTDPIFSQIHNQYGSPPEWSRPEGFETLCHIILEQQVSLESALAAYKKLKAILPDFTPQHMLALTDEEMRACYVSRQKIRYLRALSEAVREGTLQLDTLSQFEYNEAKEELKKMVGIGEWTAKIYLIMCLESPDIFPEGDIAAINTIKELKQVKSKEEAIKIAEKWSPHRTAATFFLWHYYLGKRGRKAIY